MLPLCQEDTGNREDFELNPIHASVISQILRISWIH